jgi:hypothetical protein
MGYHARRFDPATDRSALLALWRGSMSDPSIAAKVEDRYRWLYEGAPDRALRTFVVVEDGSRAVVGCTSLLPHVVSIDGELVRTAIAVDLVTAPGHRVAGPAVTMQRASVDAVARGEVAEARFCFGYPNDGALPVVKRVGYKSIAKTSHAVKPVRTGYKLRERVPAPLVAPLAFCADRALALLDHARLAQSPFAHRFAEVHGFDARFDDLFDRMRARTRVLGDRRGAFLAWRYGGCPTRAYRTHAVTTWSGDRVLAYAIHALEGRTAVLVDHLAESEAAAAALFVRLSSRLRGEGADSLFAAWAGDASLATCFERAGFFYRGEDRTFAAFVPANEGPSLREAVLSAPSWRIFDGELDI